MYGWEECSGIKNLFVSGLLAVIAVLIIIMLIFFAAKEVSACWVSYDRLQKDNLANKQTFFGDTWYIKGYNERLGIADDWLTFYLVNISSGPKIPKGKFGPELKFTK